MTELVRTIIPEDLPKVAGLLKEVFNDPHYESISRLGGMTNHSYKVTRSDGKVYLARIPGEGTEEMINRKDERKSTELACRLGIDSELLYFGDDGRKVMCFIEEPQPMNVEVMQEDEIIRQVAETFAKLHHCGVDTGVPFNVFEMAATYERIIMDAGVALYDDYEQVKGKVMAIKTAMDAKFPPTRVPCHNDSLVGNWVLDKHGRLWLIDWEYSGMNEAMWDLSCTSIECEYTEVHDEMLLNRYFGRPFTVDEKKQFVASKMYVDYLWTLWGLTRIPFDGQFMQGYADTRYSRLKANIAAYEKIGG